MSINPKVKVTTCIDWLSYTSQSSNYPPQFPTEKKELKRGMMGYDTGVQFIDGRIELCSSTRQDMGVHAIISGEAILKLCNLTDWNSFYLFGQIGMERFSRIDLAIDIKHDKLDIHQLWQDLENDNALTDAKQWLFLQGAKGNGATLYIGSPKAKRRLRIYDKKAESGTEHEWTRVELQYRGEMAQRAAKGLRNHISRPAYVPLAVNDFCTFPNNKKWLKYIGVESVKLGKPEKLQSNRAKWLLTTAAKALAKEMNEGYDGVDFLGQFVKMAIDLYSQENDKYKSSK